MVDVLAADGAIDALSGFEPTYGNRTLTAGFTVTSGPVDVVRDRLIGDLEGCWVEIILPDNPNYCMTGLVHIAAAGSRPGASLTVTAECLPWRYARQETVHWIPASDVNAQHIWRNGGKRNAVPEILVGDVPVIITVGGAEQILVAGSYLMPSLSIPGGDTITVTARGGAFSVRYREAIL